MVTLVGETLGKYKIIERIGRGGMAEVYKGYHAKLDRHVAIKILHGFLAEGEDFLARFEREAKAVATLRHQNIVQIHDFDVHDDYYYMVMEFVDGETLTDKLRALSKEGSKLPLDEVLSIIKQVADALEYAHKKGIIHRDIKPSNILIDTKGQTFLTDFGIARIASSTQFTATGALIGTPSYMSPEQCKGLKLSNPSDIYSLGIILYEMLTGNIPYDSETPLSVLQKHITEPVPTLRFLRSDLPLAFEKTISKALAKEAEDRYQNANELSEALAGAIKGIEDYPKPIEEGAKAVNSTQKPTVVMKEEEIADSTHKPTVVMAEEEEEEKPKPEKKEPVQKVKESPRPDKQVEEKPKKQPKPKSDAIPLKERIPMKIVIPVAVVVLGVILYFIFGGSIRSSCSNFEECVDSAHIALEADDLSTAVDYFEDAAHYVPGEEHADQSWIWCQRAELLEALDRPDEAAESYAICGEWERER